ncbi:thiolase family protein [Sphingobium yanoikuyae]|jgi:acetyl-CoA acetyltransferase|uniref:Thiolase family protein n=1 Tax=Sphingobium yanoikuyae TaxID=13690 RepID=A0A430BQV2_SPHYA|nr:thiolase family protein [Sphingobium yanoikuyae]RSU55085.1 thiolase family protein [Sphingobium yanoikuyae]
MSMAREAYITGIGMSEVGVRLTRSPLGLTLDAVREAIADAGLTLDQIDGVATYPGKMSTFLGFSPVSSDDVIEILGLNTRWHIGAAEATAQLGAIAEAVMAVKAGLARHVLCFRTVYEAAALARPEEFPPMERRKDVSGNSQWVSPFGAFSAANWTAQFAMRHMKRYGLTREQLAQVALNDHANAARNPRAIVKKPLTMDEYMAARMISSPFCLYDCDRFTDASTVLIVSAGDALDEVKTTPIRIAASAGSVERYSWDQAEWASAYPTGRDLWKNTDYTAKDVDTVQFYDGFAFQPITWLEGLDFCDVGEGGQFLEGGKRIALDGELPMNTGGGQLGWGRLHGFGFAYESVVQLRGEGGERQIAGDPKVAVATSGGGPMAAALLLAKD